MKIFLMWLAPVLALALPAAGGDIAPATVQPRPVITELASLSSIARPAFVGTVAARIEFDLGFQLIGTVASRPVETGDIVAKGDIIARMEPEDLDATLRTAQAGVLVASAQLRSAQSAESRARDLAALGVDSAVRLQDATRALTAAQARLDQAEAALLSARDIRSYAILLAPRDGLITQVFAEPGTTLAAGRPIVRLAGTAEREIVIDLKEQDAAGLDVGATFDATLASNPGIKASAILSRIDPVAERNTRTLRVYLTLIDPPESYRLGALARVSLAQSAEATISLPRAAILNADTAPAVWVVNRTDNTVAKQAVTLGQVLGARVRIIAGLKPGDEVVLRGVHSLTQGQIVGPGIAP
uniref:efflux RND transporter periplasmic adaptor subunit n=1 Tax=Yoonia sp. TaxID=2212373 RepID=UPI004047F2AA